MLLIVKFTESIIDLSVRHFVATAALNDFRARRGPADAGLYRALKLHKLSFCKFTMSFDDKS